MITFQDQIQQLADSFTFKSNAGDRIVRLATNAVTAAYRDIGSKSSWNYLRRRTQINTSASYSTGTIQYTASTRTLTLTGGTFPANAVSCEVLINRNVYAVQTRTDGTHLVLLSGRAPVEDIASGTSYAIVQTQYILPSDFMELRGITELERLWRVAYLTPEQMLSQTQWWFSPTTSWYFTILGAGGSGRMYIQFAPPPDIARTFDLIYQAKPRPRSLATAYSTGQVTTTVGGTTVTVTDGVLPAGLSSGCVFRFHPTTVPTGMCGDNPYIEEHLVASRTDDTHLELQTPMQTATTTGRYSVDDPIDLEQMSMQSYFDRLCEYRLMQNQQATSDAIRIKNGEVQAAWAEARAADARLNPAASVMPQVQIGLGEAVFYGGIVQP